MKWPRFVRSLGCSSTAFRCKVYLPTCDTCNTPSPLKTNEYSLKIDGWKMNFLLEWSLFRGYVDFCLEVGFSTYLFGCLDRRLIDLTRLLNLGWFGWEEWVKGWRDWWDKVGTSCEMHVKEEKEPWKLRFRTQKLVVLGRCFSFPFWGYFQVPC